MNAEARAQVLAQCAVFASVPRADLAVLAEMMRTEAFHAGATVVEIGENADAVFVVASGTLSVFLLGATEPVRQMRRGDVLGEYGLVGSATRTARVRADEEAVLLSLDYDRFREYLQRFPEALFVLFQSAVRRLVEAERQLAASRAPREQ